MMDEPLKCEDCPFFDVYAHFETCVLLREAGIDPEGTCRNLDELREARKIISRIIKQQEENDG